jgi:phosphoserine phosphatase RsbU/P
MPDALYESGPFGFFAFTDSGTIVTINETAAAELKYSKPQLQGKDLEKIFTLPTRIFYQTHFFPLVKMQGHAEEIFISLLCSDGEQLPVLLNAKRMDCEGSVVTCCAFIIVRNRKKYEDELVAARKTAEKALNENIDLLKVKNELQQQASELDKQVHLVNRQNDELRQFSHVISHSLREPLRKILMFSSILEKDAGNMYLDKMVRSVHQLGRVVESLQQYVWLNEKRNNFAEVDLNVIVADAEKQIKDEFGNDILNISYDHLTSITGDADQLQLLFYQILSNSVRYKKHETAGVTISTVIIKQNTFRNVEDKYQYEDYLKMEITDDGIGFESEYSNLIFELFQKLNNSEGQGLGLALCKRVAENHGGYIEAESKYGEYTKITVWLPLIGENTSSLILTE